MFAETLTESTILEVIKETEVEDGSSVKLELRVLDKKRWAKMMVDLLVDSAGEDDYGVAINKAYWADPESEKIRFCWVIIIWGDLNQALVALSPLLSRKVEKVVAAPPPEATMVAQQGYTTIVERRRLRGDGEGMRGEATVIRLPHRKLRTGHGGKTKKPGDIGRRGKWGFAEAIGGDGGDPWY
jgi:hypothetical protein